MSKQEGCRGCSKHGGIYRISPEACACHRSGTGLSFGLGVEEKFMFIKRLHDCPEFIAGDNTILRELLHPAKADLALRYSLAHAVLKPGEASRPHRLETSEVYYILEGGGEMHIDAESEPVRPGDAVYIPPHSVQYIRNTSDTELKFLCIVDPAWRKEDEEVL